MRSWLIEARQKAGLTQAELAEKLDISESYVSHIENGKRQQPMDIVLLFKLADVFGISVMEIAKLEGVSQ